MATVPHVRRQTVVLGAEQVAGSRAVRVAAERSSPWIQLDADQRGTVREVPDQVIDVSEVEVPSHWSGL